ncbi:hypothetical protein [Winogradskyella sp. SYSU M77433]|uniref:hypothetical protein n=1 Tax=Winogradskyella sp. SYSU M77433 TaxID=3042722 RepID=UPI00248059C7|nr:hypothetical protein [Winogradskyella sp. SYSU M77433]MDH7911369.1 hypothetical protein [Winogradskyella sp. SYSU M77433]
MPENSTPVLARRFYPTLSSIVNQDEIPDALGFIKDGIAFLFDKIHFKDLQYSKSPRGDAAFYSLSIVTKDRVDIEIPGTGVFLVLNPDISTANPDNTISAFPITIEYEWRILAYLRSFNLDQFDFSPKAFFETALRVLSISQEQAIANFINTFTEPVGGNSSLQQFVNDMHAFNTDAGIDTNIDDNTTLTDVVRDIYVKTQDYATLTAFGAYILNNNLEETKEKLKVYFQSLLPQDIEEYIKDILIPKFRATLLLTAAIEFPRNMLKPVYPEGHPNALEVIPEDPGDEFPDNVMLSFGEALFYADTEKGFGYNMDIVLNTNTPAQIGNTGLIIDIHNLKIDLSTEENIVEANLDNRPPEFMGVYMERTDVFLPKKWFKKDTGQTLAITGERLLIGTGGMSGSIALRATYAKDEAGQVTDYFSEYFEFNYPITVLSNGSPEIINDGELLPHINALESPYDLRFKFPLSITSNTNGSVYNFESESDYYSFINAIDVNRFMWFKLGKNPDKAWKIGFDRFDLVFHHGEVIESNLHAQLVIPKLRRVNGETNENGETIIDLTGHWNNEDNFNLTAAFLPTGLDFTLFNFVTINMLSAEVGRQDDNFYIGTSCEIWFQNDIMNKILDGQKIVIPNFRIYDNGNMEIVGGTGFIPTNISLNLGPVEIAVTGIHFGSHQREHNGIMRKYNYWGFDGAISLDPLGVDARGEGIKYYYTVDNEEVAVEHGGNPEDYEHSYLHIKTIEVDLIIPGNADPSNATAIIHGMLSIPEPGESPEYIGEVSVRLPKAKIGGGAAMRLQPRHPAFLIEAGIEIPVPIPLAATGVGFYGFGGLLGYKYVAEKAAVNLSQEDRWYDYFVYPQRGVNLMKFSGPERNHDIPFSVGAGTVLGTMFDDGFTFSTRLMAILSLPSVFILDGRANILGERIAMLDNSEPPFFAGVAFGDSSLEFWFGADYQLPNNGFIIDLFAEVQAGFFFNNPSAWYLNFGTKENPISARFLTILTAQSFLMLSSQGIEAGARVELDLKKNFFGIKVELNAYVEAGGFISFERPQLGGYVAMGGMIRVSFWKVAGFKIKLDAILSAEAAEPFLLYAELRIRICIKLIFRICSPRVTLKLKWGGDDQPNRDAIAPLPNAGSHHIDRTEQSVKGIHMLTGEVFDINFLTVVQNGDEINVDPDSITEIIPVDTFIDFKAMKGLIPGEVSGLIGGYNNPPSNYVDLIPPKKVVKGGRELRQVKHKYSIEHIEINALDKDGNWKPYHPFQAVVKPEDGTVDFTDLPFGYWQKSSKQYNAVRLLATNPFSYLTAGEPGWLIPEQMGIGPSDLFCEGEQRDINCMDFQVSPSLGATYYPPTQFEFHDINGVFFNLVGFYFETIEEGEPVTISGDNFRISDASNSHGYTRSLEFDNYNALEILLPEPSTQVDLLLNTHAQGVNIIYYRTLLNNFNSSAEYEQITSVYKTANELQNVVSYTNEEEFISKIIISPNTPNSDQIDLIQSQIAALYAEAYSNASGQDAVILSANEEAQINSWEAQLAELKGEACTLPVRSYYFVNQYNENVSKTTINIPDLFKYESNYFSIGNLDKTGEGAMVSRFINKFDEQGNIIESFETLNQCITIKGDTLFKTDEVWIDYKFVENEERAFDLRATKFNNNLDVIWNKDVLYNIEISDPKNPPSNYIKALNSRYTIFSIVNTKNISLNLTLLDKEGNKIHFVSTSEVPIDLLTSIIKISPYNKQEGASILIETKGEYFLLDFMIESDKIVLNEVQKLDASSVYDIENISEDLLLISSLIDEKFCITINKRTDGFVLDHILTQTSNEPQFTNLKFISKYEKDGVVYVRNSKYVFKIQLSEKEDFNILEAWRVADQRNEIKFIRYDLNEDHFVVYSALIEGVNDTYTGIVKYDFNTCIFIPYSVANGFESLELKSSIIEAATRDEEVEQIELDKSQTSASIILEEICPVTFDDITPQKCYTSLQRICWMTLENFEYNSAIPGQAAIVEDQKFMVEAVEKVVQPIWRPNTKYFIKFTLKDEVDNGESQEGIFDYYYGFKTVGPVGHFQHHPEVDYLPQDANPDQYPITSLRQYIDYNRSYPNADGSLLQAKPIFYGNEQCKISLFFDKQWAYHMLNSWSEYQDMNELSGALHIAIKDPVTDVIIPYPLPADFDESVPEPTNEVWESDTDPSIPTGILLLNNLINHINTNSSHISCELTIGDPLSPAGYTYNVTLSNLKPQKLYTALFYNAFEVNSDNVLDSKEIHQYVFQTSRYRNFEEQVNSYILIDEESEETRPAIFELPINVTADEVTTAYNIVAGISDLESDALESDYQHLFDRVIQGVWGITPMDPAVSTEFNIIKNNGQVIGILIRNPEPFNIPKIPLDVIADTISVVDDINDYSVLHSKDYSQALIMHSDGFISATNISIEFLYKTWNGNSRQYELSDTVIVQELEIQ